MRCLILDVGCGDRPKGDVNVDLFQGESVDLQGLREKINPKETVNFVQATIYNLPFRNNLFSIVLCHHLLEHLKRPKEAINELIRVSKRQVQIIVPYKWHEIIQNWFQPERRAWAKKHHLWNFTKSQLESLFEEMNLQPSIRYQYKFLAALKDFKTFQRRNFKQFIIYGILEAFLPPTPGELIVTIIKTDKPITRAT